MVSGEQSHVFTTQCTGAFKGCDKPVFGKSRKAFGGDAASVQQVGAFAEILHPHAVMVEHIQHKLLQS